MVLSKSANQLWKEQRMSGQTTLAFKSWLKEEKEKGFINVDGATQIPVNRNLNTSIQDTLLRMHETAGYKTSATDTHVLGINKKALIWAGISVGVLIVVIIVYKKVNE